MGCFSRSAPKARLSAADAEALDEGLVARLVLLSHVVEKRAALRNHLEQAATGVVVLNMSLEVVGQIGDSLGENGDLNLWRTGVADLHGVLVDERGLALGGDRHRVVPWSYGRPEPASYEKTAEPGCRPGRSRGEKSAGARASRTARLYRFRPAAPEFSRSRGDSVGRRRLARCVLCGYQADLSRPTRRCRLRPKTSSPSSPRCRLKPRPSSIRPSIGSRIRKRCAVTFRAATRKTCSSRTKRGGCSSWCWAKRPLSTSSGCTRRSARRGGFLLVRPNCSRRHGA